jgi:hypothetical protein
MMTLCESANDFLDVTKAVSNIGSAGIVLWIVYWLLKVELPRRDAQAAALATAYERRIEAMAEAAVKAAERYASDLKSISASHQAELQRLRENDVAERRVERAEMTKLVRDQMAVAEELIRQVRALPPRGA